MTDAVYRLDEHSQCAMVMWPNRAAQPLEVQNAMAHRFELESDSRGRLSPLLLHNLLFQ
ncbi:hypothetical protein SISNIDRAFT_452863 [Sistotremastrum niveocremeum HHB9708]|uniref:Uncharacterized protein n=2 Tax=Sistotremastraceae TaxID=3402574 RepID=A0A164W5D9_9AGAM|nr:hypothetical protein SISNIDRAFT_452863 [Sistotremastrum niveocremeum HHB9708]KZT41721.1 hypothetical protein SISSUDRAFT_1042527 [Sistotremastrum suecicum HHB10207 ss-3]